MPLRRLRLRLLVWMFPVHRILYPLHLPLRAFLLGRSLARLRHRLLLRFLLR